MIETKTDSCSIRNHRPTGRSNYTIRNRKVEKAEELPYFHPSASSRH
jgi:hypothetical protein